jgi:hypothetical protein
LVENIALFIWGKLGLFYASVVIYNKEIYMHHDVRLLINV